MYIKRNFYKYIEDDLKKLNIKEIEHRLIPKEEDKKLYEDLGFTSSYVRYNLEKYL